MDKQGLKKLTTAAVEIATEACDNSSSTVIGPIAAALILAALSSNYDASVRQALLER